MTKICVFCGKEPNGKNKEHVIPRWLIEFTGNPKRMVCFGLDWNSKDLSKMRKFAFDQFTFPACSSCNTKYSKLEECGKSAFLKIINEKTISAEEISIFLDWFDKIRVGVWLGMLQLNKGVFPVNPNFAIENRIGQSDRLLVVQKVNAKGTRLSIQGTDVIHFYMTPSAFGLYVNNFHFTNVSYISLFARRLGFPYVKKQSFMPDTPMQKIECSYGTNRVMRPIMKSFFNFNSVRIFQPMFGSNLIIGERRKFFENDYIQQHSLDYAKGIGNIFIEDANSLNELGYSNDFIFKFKENEDETEFDYRNQLSIMEWHLYLRKLHPNTDLLNQQQKDYVLKESKLIKAIGNKYLQGHKEQLDNYRKLKSKMLEGVKIKGDTAIIKINNNIFKK